MVVFGIDVNANAVKRKTSASGIFSTARSSPAVACVTALLNMVAQRAVSANIFGMCGRKSVIAARTRVRRIFIITVAAALA